MYSSSGSATFLRSVRELHRAPLWNSIPKVLSSPRRAAVSALVNDSPKKLTLPAVGWFRPTKWRSSVLLPQPEPPMMKKISPRRTVNETFFSTVLPS